MIWGNRDDDIGNIVGADGPAVPLQMQQRRREVRMRNRIVGAVLAAGILTGTYLISSRSTETAQSTYVASTAPEPKSGTDIQPK